MTTTAADAGSTAVVLDWLSTQPSSDTVEEVGQLRHHLDLLKAPGIAPIQHHRCIELFFGRGLRIASDLKPRLIEAGLPLERVLHAAARHLAESLTEIAHGFMSVNRHVREGSIRPQRRLGETLAARGLRMLTEALEISALAGGGVPPDLWPKACELLSAGSEEPAPAEPEAAGESVQFGFKRLVALGSLQLECFSQNEIAWVSEYLNRIATLLQIEDRPPANLDSSWYWLASNSNEGPQSVQRKAPSDSGVQRTLYISSNALAKRVAEHLARLEAGQQPFELNLPKLAVGVQPMALLQRLRHEWAMPAKREQPRRKAHYSVQACTSIDAVWRVLRSGAENDPDIHEWQVLNESPGGFAIMHVAGAVDGLSAGMAVGLRREPQEPWTICIVRWIRSENPAQIELGLQVVSTGATPVMVGFRGARERPSRMVNALVLPALPALRHHPAILAPTGTYTSRRFALVSDLDRVYVAQGRLLSLDMQTANVELFQFEIDPYPI